MEARYRMLQRAFAILALLSHRRARTRVPGPRAHDSARPGGAQGVRLSDLAERGIGAVAARETRRRFEGQRYRGIDNRAPNVIYFGLEVSEMANVASMGSTPKPRREKNVDKFVKRVGTELTKALGRQREDIYEQAIGGSAGSFRIEATDGHRALLIAGAGTNDGTRSYGWLAKLPPYSVQLDPEFQLALRRVLTCAPARRREAGCHRIVVTFEPRPEPRLVLHASDPMEECEATEWLPIVAHEAERFRFAVNGKYLDSALGLWPARLYFGPEASSMLMVRDATDSWRIVMMPIDLHSSEALGPEPEVSAGHRT